MTVTMVMIMIVMMTMTVTMTMININFATTTKTPSVGLGNCFFCFLWKVLVARLIQPAVYLWTFWNISLQVKLFADALDSGSFDKHSSPLIIQAGSFETHPLHHFLILTISIILLILFILIPPPPHPQSVRGGVKLHINVYWLPTVSNKKWDLLGQKARGPSIYSKSEPKLSKAPPTGDLFASRLPFSDLIGFSSFTPHPPSLVPNVQDSFEINIYSFLFIVQIWNKDNKFPTQRLHASPPSPPPSTTPAARLLPLQHNHGRVYPNHHHHHGHHHHGHPKYQHHPHNHHHDQLTTTTTLSKFLDRRYPCRATPWEILLRDSPGSTGLAFWNNQI